MNDKAEAVAQDAVFESEVDEATFGEGIDIVTPEVENEEKTPEEGENEDKDGSAEGSERKEEKDPEKEEVDPKYAEMEAQIEKLKKDNSEMGYNLRQLSKEKKKEEKKEPVFTKNQLLGLFNDHKDDPDMLFQVVSTMVDQGVKDASKVVEETVELREKKSTARKYIQDFYPTAWEENSDLNAGIQDAVKWANLDDHPMAEELAMGVVVLQSLPTMIKEIQEKAVQEAEAKLSEQNKENLKEKSEAARKKGIKDSQPAKTETKTGASDKKESVSLNESQAEVAKRLNMGPAQMKKYAAMMAASKAA